MITQFAKTQFAKKAAKQVKEKYNRAIKLEQLFEKTSRIAMSTEDKRIKKLNKNISKECIIYFKETFSRCLNDYSNNKREDILIIILNKRVSQEFLEYDSMWGILSQRACDCVDNIITSETSEGITLMNLEFVRAGGRGKHHDILVVANGIGILKIEFKYGENTVEKQPQIVSPTKPSQYMTISFEEFYYTFYLPKIVENESLTVPEKYIYMKQIHSNQPTCMIDFKKKYDAGCESSSKFTNKDEDKQFYKKCNEISKTAIREFLSKDDVELDHKTLSNYLFNTQKKVYLLYKDGQFTSQRIDPNEFVIDSYVKEPEKYRFVATTRTGRRLNILLRFKNGNGVAFPAFQISLK